MLQDTEDRIGEVADIRSAQERPQEGTTHPKI